MKYTIKLYISLVATAIISTALALTIYLTQARYSLFREIQSKVIAIASTTSAAINGDQLRALHAMPDENSPAYILIRDNLRKVRNANRRSDIYVRYLYTSTLDPKNPEKVIFGVDAEEDPARVSHIGDDNPGAAIDHLQDHLEEKYANDEMTTDPWGTWLTGYAPIYDSQGKYVGSIGVDINARVVSQFLNQLFFFTLPALILSLTAALILASFLANRASKALVSLILAAQEYEKGNLDYRVLPCQEIEFNMVATEINLMAEGLQEKERIKSGFARYVSQHVLEKILKETKSTSFQGEKRKITVFFSAIRNFAKITETAPPEELVSVLNEYFNLMLGIVFKRNGMFDKFTQEGLMLEFGIPLPDPDQERNAVLTAIEMQRSLEPVRNQWKLKGKPTIEMTVGIHTGDAIVGNIGSAERMEFTAIGDTVNVAARLESIATEKNFGILVSESTFKALNNEFPSQDLGPVALRGKDEQIHVYAIFYNLPQ